jgi:hypothetical protein
MFEWISQTSFIISVSWNIVIFIYLQIILRGYVQYWVDLKGNIYLWKKIYQELNFILPEVTFILVTLLKRVLE